MKDFLRIFACTILVAAVLSAPVEESEQQVQEGNAKFAKNLYKVIAKDETGNVFFSPLSAHAALSMVYVGADGSTKDAMAQGLQVPTPEVAADGYDKIMGYLNNVQNSTLEIANTAYLKDSVKFQATYEQIIKDKFHSEVNQIDFAQKDAAADTINSWVKDKTHDKIDKLFEADDFDSLTRLVLVNAVYFKGIWQNPFHKEATEKQTFYVDEKTEVEVDMMHVSGSFNYKDSDELQAQVLELPYTSEDVSMVIVLPKDKHGITALEEKVFQHENLKELTGNRQWTNNIDVSFPKFKIEKTIQLNDKLKQIGLEEVFDQDKSDLSKMIEGDEKLYVSKAIQKAFIEVNEEGATAAAATGIEVSNTYSLVVQERITVNVDHPFLFLLKAKDNVLFVGKISNPSVQA